LEFDVKNLALATLILLGACGSPPAPAAAPAASPPPPKWIAGVHYDLVDTIPRTAPPPGKIVVTEVFSYGCPACNDFNPIARRLIASLPANVIFQYVPAGFIASEDWPMFQRAFCTAESLGIAGKTHDAMFDAVWKSGELATMNVTTHQLLGRMPTIEDASRFYAKQAGVKAADFVAAANSFDVDRRIRASNEFIRDFRIDSTPTIVVNSKYRTTPHQVASYDEFVELVNFLVAKEKK
jgi:protein dithiol oxidoreductase (disulfide-forming)